MSKFPVAGQSFVTIRRKNLLYIDKTEYIYKIIEDEGCYFLSRPRRFGKSLLLGAMEELFKGNRQLFKGLAIDSLGYDFQPYPVIKLSMAGLIGSTEGNLTDEALRETGAANIIEFLRYRLRIKLSAAASDNKLDAPKLVQDKGLNFSDIPPNSLLEIILQTLHDKTDKKVVVLIDEYDSPIQSVISDSSLADEIRKELHNFYSSLKTYSDDNKIHFLFVTGITKFAKASFFSVFNNYLDLTLDSHCAGICGFTMPEFEEHLVPFLPDVLESKKSEGSLAESVALDEFKQMVLDQYDGYTWDGKTRILNPFSLINFLYFKKLNSYWYQSGTPTFLMDLVRENPYEITRPDSFSLSTLSLSSLDIGHLSLVPLLFQTGYLTVDKVMSDTEYLLKEPNSEVSEAFNVGIMNALTNKTNKNIDELAKDINQALHNVDNMLLTKCFTTILDWFPYEIHVPLEYYYHSIIHCVLKVLKYKIESDVSQSGGRIDMVLEYSSKCVFVMEFKFESLVHKKTVANADGTEEVKTITVSPEVLLPKLLKDAKNQIEAKNYSRKYENEFETVHKVAVGIAGRTNIAVEIYK
ncbi:MAG: ATP-binding protein [Deltaproteobacteria bacterium]|nr:ATP-binding protein [Deltaproteobacteria bacterium]